MMCYCESNTDFPQCCEPFIYGYDVPQTAEQLMRSRYSAFCMNHHHYLNNTSALPTIDSTSPSIRWVGLRIIQSVNGGPFDSTGTVEFKAFFMEENTYYELHEISQFEKRHGHWLYIDGKSMG